MVFLGVIVLLFFMALPGIMFGIVCCRAAEWCLGRRWRVLRVLAWLVLAALAVATVYGLLRLAGIIRLPGDNTWSVNLFDASWRDVGILLLLNCGAPLAGTVAALLRERRDK